jgi:hypothetical protein
VGEQWNSSLWAMNGLLHRSNWRLYSISLLAMSGLPMDHKSGRFPASKIPVNKKNDDRADHRADQTGSFARSVPAEHLSEVAGYESANDAEDGGEDEPLRLIGSRHHELGDNARDKPDDVSR